MPSGPGRDAAVEAADQAAGWLPGFASALHRDARAPVNLTPIAGQRADPLKSRLGGLQPFPPLHAANAAHAGYREASTRAR